MEQIKCPGQDTRHWKPGDIFTTECPKCGAEIEFFKDDTRRRCAWCGHLFYNPKIELGCAEWCQYADKCVPELVKEK
jgi:ribosomal protein S27E